jgi:hypothetical protein
MFKMSVVTSSIFKNEIQSGTKAKSSEMLYQKSKKTKNDQNLVIEVFLNPSIRL